MREVNAKLIRPLKPGDCVFIGVLMKAPAPVFWFNGRELIKGHKHPLFPVLKNSTFNKLQADKRWLAEVKIYVDYWLTSHAYPGTGAERPTSPLATTAPYPGSHCSASLNISTRY